MDFERFLEDYCLAALRLANADSGALEPADHERVAGILVSAYRRVERGPAGGRSGVLAIIRQECARREEERRR